MALHFVAIFANGEEEVGVPGAGVDASGAYAPDVFGGALAEEDEALFVALAMDDFDAVVGEVDVGQADIAEFGGPDASGE